MYLCFYSPCLLYFSLPCLYQCLHFVMKLHDFYYSEIYHYLFHTTCVLCTPCVNNQTQFFGCRCLPENHILRHFVTHFLCHQILTASCLLLSLWTLTLLIRDWFSRSILWNLILSSLFLHSWLALSQGLKFSLSVHPCDDEWNPTLHASPSWNISAALSLPS